MKKYWHTWTLFINWWKYKWAYKYEHCIECWQSNSKHKGKWLCTKCWDKERGKTGKRKRQNMIKSRKFYYKERILMFLVKTEFKKKKRNWTNESMDIYKKEWYKQNKERISLEKKTKTRLKNWLPCLQMYIKWKLRYFAFAWIDKPKVKPEFDLNYQKTKKEYNILKSYYEKQS